MIKPFDSKVEHTRDDAVPLLEFRYRGRNLSQGETLAAVLSVSFIITAPLAAIPIVRGLRKRMHILLDKDGLTVNKDRYEKQHIQRVRTSGGLQQNDARVGRVYAVVFDYGVKQKVLANRLSEPELLWIYGEVQDFIGQHWTDLGPQRF
jgi:hypothetical protein